MDLLKMPIPEILASHTDGQLYCMAIASRVQVELMKREMKKSERSSRRGAPARFSDEPPSRPPKPIKMMTKAELEDYYMRSGAWG